MVQNHLLQVVALLAMEPPVDAHPDSLRDEKVKVLKAMQPADPAHLVRGQYDGYLDEAGVAPDSGVETFAAPNVVCFRLGHPDGVTLCVQAKEPGERLVSHPVELDVDFERALGARQEAYVRLLADALDGNPARFAREDGVEHEWRVVQRLLDHPGPVHRYPRGSWGPPEADAVVARHQGWSDPAP